MRRLLPVCLGCTLALILGFALLAEFPGPVEERIAWVKSLGAGEPAPVLVLLVGDRSGVATVRAAVEASRILVETPDAIVLREGRVVATGPEAVGDPLREAGFADRKIELWAPGHRDRRKSRAGEETKPSLATLARKPTLTPLEVLAILNGSVSGVEI